MSKCPYCEHDNAAGAQRCQKCGAWMSDQVGNQDTATSQPSASARPAVSASTPAPGTGLTAEVEAELVALLRQQRKIDAIKLHRQKTGSGLKEAKEAVEALAASRGILVKSAGCLGVLMLIIAVTLAATVHWISLAW